MQKKKKKKKKMHEIKEVFVKGVMSKLLHFVVSMQENSAILVNKCFLGNLKREETNEIALIVNIDLAESLIAWLP